MVKRKIDELGRVVIPRDLRAALGLTPQTPLTMELSGERIILEKACESCALCGAPVAENSTLSLCKKCIAKVKKL